MRPAQVGGYPIRVVAERTGLGVETLRQWERRYGYPTPARNTSGARVYDDATLERLQQIARALEQGFRPSDVVGRSPAELERVLASMPPRSGAPPPGEDLLDGVIDALTRDDLDAVALLLRRAVLLLGPRGFVTQHVALLAQEVGDRWASGQLDVRQEHAFSDLVTTQLRIVRATFEPSRRAPLLLLATLSGEQHALGIEMVAVYAVASGVHVRVLGPDTPPEEIAAAARALGASAVGISISEHTAGEPARENVRALLAAMPSDVRVWIGGSGARSLDPHSRIESFDDWSPLDEALERL